MVKLKVIKNSTFKDNRGFYWTTWKKGILKNIKFNHKGSSSLPKKFNKLVMETRSFHFNWSKFYFYKKNYFSQLASL